MFNSIVENFTLAKSSAKIVQSGGSEKIGNGFMIFFISLSVFFIKVLLVMISYNIVVPRILENWGNDLRRFRPITFVESIFLVILFNNLFSRF